MAEPGPEADPLQWAARGSGTGQLRLSSWTTLAGGFPKRYCPPELEGRAYYEPSSHGFEEEIAKRMRQNAEQTRDPQAGTEACA